MLEKVATYDCDCKLEIRKSYEKPDIVKLYDEFLDGPLGHQCHHLVHTKYISRKE